MIGVKIGRIGVKMSVTGEKTDRADVEIFVVSGIISKVGMKITEARKMADKAVMLQTRATEAGAAIRAIVVTAKGLIGVMAGRSLVKGGGVVSRRDKRNHSVKQLGISI